MSERAKGKCGGIYFKVTEEERRLIEQRMALMGVRNMSAYIRKATCAFTGHRPKSFPWGYNESAPGCILLKEVLAAQIFALAEQGVTDFLSGMAQGVDLWCAQIVLDLRKTTSALKLHAILPCEGQERKWTASAQEHYRSILAQANAVIYVGQEYSRNGMLERNRYLVDHSSILLAVYNGSYRSGTGMTVRYAQKLGREVIIIDPISRDMKYSHKSQISGY